MSDQPRKISHFHLGKVVHEGGKSELYEARYTHSGGVVQSAALKLLRPWLACIGDELRAFLRELAWARDLRSPVLPRILEAGEQGGNYFLAMEFVEGCTLAELLRSLAVLQMPLPCQVGLSVVNELALGLHQIHEFAEDGEALGVVHLGVEPDNIMLRNSGAVVLLDLGLTQAASDEVTSLEEPVGDYRAPEHLRMLPLDRRADVYSLGCVLRDLTQSMAERELGDDMAALLARACHVHAEERFASMADFSIALEMVAQNRGFGFSEAACQRFLGEVFGEDDKRTDPRARRPQSVAPFAMQSEGLPTAFAPSLDPESVDGAGASGETFESAATAIAEGSRTGASGGDEGLETAIGGDNGLATVMGGPDASETGEDGLETVMGGADGMETVMGGPDPMATEAQAARPEALDEGAFGEREFGNDEPTAQNHGDSAGRGDSAGQDEADSRSTARRKRFVDQHMAVTVMGSPQKLADMALSEETTVVSQDDMAGGGFPEELIPTRNNKTGEPGNDSD